MTLEPEEPSYLRLRRRRAEPGAEPSPDAEPETPRLDPTLYEPAYDEPAYEPGEYEATEDQSLLRNPYMLAGLAVGAAIVLAVMVVILFGGGGGKGNGGSNGSTGSNVVIGALTPVPGSSSNVSAKSIALSTVREGPSTDAEGIGELRSGQDVDVVGRNNDASWFQITYPARTLLRGWVPSSALKLPAGFAESLAVVIPTPIPRPTVIPPTLAPEPTGTPAPSPTATASSVPGPDIALSVATGSCPQVGAPLLVTLTNAGKSPISNRRIRITVTGATGVLGVMDTVVSLEAGAAVTLPTNHAMQAPRTSARVEMLDTPADVNPGNNAVECAVTGAAPTPTLTPPTIPPLPPTRVPGLP